jgi:uncharacterized protein
MVAFALLLLAVTILPFAARRLADWLWYRDLGYERVFLTKVVAQWVLFLTGGIVAFAVLFGNVRVALSGAALDPLLAGSRFDAEAPTRAYLTRLADSLVIPGAALLSFVIALVEASEWRTALRFFYRTPFGVADPVFARDVGYYVFTLPAIEDAIDLAGLLVLLAGALVVPIYLVRGKLLRRRWRLIVDPFAAAHLGVLAAALLVVSALRIRFVRVPSLLLAEHGPFFGASYTDLHTRLPVLHGLSVIALVCAVLVLVDAARGRNLRLGVRALGAYVAAAVLASVVPVVYQRLVVQPNELAREAPQIVHHIHATRQAWGIDSVERRELGGETRLTPADIAANRATIDNVRLWDREPLLQTFGQIQSIRTYYDFVSVDDDRYRIGGELRQVMLSARELNSEALPTRTFINEHLTYTHGMGVTLGPSNQVTGQGLPVLFIKDLPPVSTTPALRIARPEIYFGELSNTFVLAPTRQREFDYPAGEGAGEAAVYSSYAGSTGVRAGSLLRRALFALRFGSLNILLSGALTDSSRILYHRNVRERAQRALPFLYFDGDPYLVVTGAGRLKWILDAYTVSDRYPYAQPSAEGINYMRNSVKVVIDAYDGDVQAYLAAPDDPIIRTLSRIYPGALRPIDSLDADLRAHLRYPEDLFRMQTALYATYHMSDPETFYHREDQWQIPGSPAGARGTGSRSFIRHMVMRLPGQREPEFILMRPFTPRQKDNLAAWMVARNDGVNYGKLVAYRFPRQSLVFGPTQIVNRINQDTEVARQISLWDQRGSEVIRGELLVLPIEQSLMYVQPIYLRAEGGRIPELKRVVVAHEGQVAMEESLDAGLARLFGSGGRSVASPPTELTSAVGVPARSDSAAALLRQAIEHYDRARAAQRADDWAAYGAEMRQLGELLRRLSATTRN